MNNQVNSLSPDVYRSVSSLTIAEDDKIINQFKSLTINKAKTFEEHVEDSIQNQSKPTNLKKERMKSDHSVHDMSLLRDDDLSPPKLVRQRGLYWSEI